MHCRFWNPRLALIAVGLVGIFTTVSIPLGVLSFWRQVSLYAGPASLTIEHATSRLTIERHPVFPLWGFTAIQTRQQRDRWWFSVRTESRPDWALDIYFPAWFGPALSVTGVALLVRRCPRSSRHRCASCGYALAGLPIDVPCPECGGPSARATAEPQPALSRSARAWRACSRSLFLVAGACTAIFGLSLVVQAEVLFERSTALVRSGGLEIISGRLSLDPGFSILFSPNSTTHIAWWFRRDTLDGHPRTTWPLWPLPVTLSLAAAVPSLTTSATRRPAPARRRSPPAPPQR